MMPHSFGGHTGSADATRDVSRDTPGRTMTERPHPSTPLRERAGAPVLRVTAGGRGLPVGATPLPPPGDPAVTTTGPSPGVLPAAPDRTIAAGAVPTVVGEPGHG
ncbi:hypothetical protein GCM10027160_36080 [Streptomyces calidiresistens]